MSIVEIVSIGASVILSFGGAGAIILALSAWLGKVWANRIMEQDRAKYAEDIETLKSQLERSNNKEIEEIKNDLSIFKEHHLKGLHDKIAMYRMVIELVSEVLGDFDYATETKTKISSERFDKVNRQRIKVYGYLAMMAPQSLMDAQDKLMDHLLLVAHGKKSYEWPEVRDFAHGLLNEMRKDLKFDNSPIKYNGVL